MTPYLKPLRNLAIVGGGPGGLMTAYWLQKSWYQPVEITLFEASSRLGGKVQTCLFPEVGEPYEVGAAEIYDYSTIDEDPLKELIYELGLSINSMGGSAVIQDQTIISNLDDVELHLGAAARHCLERFDRRSRDAMSPWEFYQSDEPGLKSSADTSSRFDSLLTTEITNRATRRYIDHLIHSDLATESPQTTVSYGLQNYLMNHPAYMRLYSIVGGNEQLPKALAARLRANVNLEHQVTRIVATAEAGYR
ncbi:MAG: FAD-dependent oxidoreductase, partial [Planctomycetota bacterium]